MLIDYCIRIDTVQEYYTITITLAYAFVRLRREIFRECYREMLILEDKYAGSVFHKYENFDEHRTWHFSSAVFFGKLSFLFDNSHKFSFHRENRCNIFS